MKNFQKKREIKDYLQSKVFLVFLTIILLLFIWNIIGVIGKLRETSKNRKIAEDKITELTKEKERLNTDIQKLSTEKGVEENIRDKFGLAKQGEGVIIIVDDKNSPANNTENKSTGFLSFFKNLFK